MSLDSYLDLATDPAAFSRVARTPEPVYVRLRRRTGPLRPGATDSLPDREDPLDLLAASGFRLEETGFADGVLRVIHAPFPIGKALGHWLGDIFVQQAVTAIAAPCLGVRPGDRVLDMCSAPGGKGIHLSDLMANRGPLVLVERSERRIQSLLANVYRCGVLNAQVVSADGRRLGGSALFDRILVDAPCSGEGNLRKRDGVISPISPGSREALAKTQLGLLRKAVDLVKPGGTILYVTCTFHPRENESVVSRLLRERPGEVEVEQIPVDLPHDPGVRGFEGETYESEVEQAWRLYPHHLDSGGLFLCRLRRIGGSPEEAVESPLHVDGWRALPERLGAFGVKALDGSGHVSIEPHSATQLFEERFGVQQEVSDSLHWMTRGDSVWISTSKEWSEQLWTEGRGRLVSPGLRAAKVGSGGWLRPTSEILQVMDHFVTRESIALPDSVWPTLLARQPVPPNSIADGEPTTGHVALRVRGRVVGRGRLSRDGIVHEIPKARASQLGESLDLL